MADQTTTWTVKMEDQVSGTAEAAAESLEKLGEQITSDTKEIGAMQRALKNLKGAVEPNKDQIEALTKRITAQKQAVAQMQSRYIAQGGTFKQGNKAASEFMKRVGDLAKAAGGVKESPGIKEVKEQIGALAKEAAKPKESPGLKAIEAQLKGLTDQATKIGGPLGNLFGHLGKMRAVLAGGAIAAGILAIVAALAALVVATASAVRALYKYGVAQADARRSELLRLEGLTKLRFMYQRQAGNAKEMQSAIDRVAASTPTAREELAKYTNQLYRMGLRGPALEKTLEGVSIKLSTQGEEAANAFAGWAAGANMAGKGVDRLVDHVKAKLGGVAQAQMKSLEVQTRKQKEAFDSLFSGLDIEAWLGAWKEVRDLLGQTTASGRALKQLVTLLLDPLINTSTRGAPIVKRFFQGMIIAALDLTIILLKVRNAILDIRDWIQKTFGDKSLIEDWGTAATIGEIAFWGLFGVLSLIGVVVAGIAASLLLVMAPAIAFVGFVALLVYWFWQLEEALSEVFAWLFTKLPGAFDGIISIFQGLGGMIIEGIIAGISLTPLANKMKDVAIGGLKAFQKAIGAESPAKAFMPAGRAIPAGVAEGVDQGAGEAEQATANMLGAAAGMPNLPMPKEGKGDAAGGTRAGRGGNTITIGSIQVNASSNDPKQMAQDFRRELEAVLEGLVLEIGAPVPS